jgi:hypothetical protein
VKESLSSLPALPIKEEDTKYTVEDTLTEGVEIAYPNQTNKEENTEEVKPSLTLRFPKKYATEPMEVQIAAGQVYPHPRQDRHWRLHFGISLFGKHIIKH